MGWLSPDPASHPASQPPAAPQKPSGSQPAPAQSSLSTVSRANARTSQIPVDFSPSDILFYSIIHSHVKCHCGSEMRISRMWMCYGTEKRNDSRPLGLSESIYSGIRINEQFEPTYGTPACAECLDGAIKSPLPRSGTVTGGSNLRSVASVIGKVASKSPTKAPGAPKPASEPSIDDLLKSMS